MVQKNPNIITSSASLKQKFTGRPLGKVSLPSVKTEEALWKTPLTACGRHCFLSCLKVIFAVTGGKKKKSCSLGLSIECSTCVCYVWCRHDTVHIATPTLCVFGRHGSVGKRASNGLHLAGAARFFPNKGLRTSERNGSITGLEPSSSCLFIDACGD